MNQEEVHRLTKPMMNCHLNSKVGLEVEPQQSHRFEGDGEQSTCGRTSWGQATSKEGGSELAGEEAREGRSLQSHLRIALSCAMQQIPQLCKVNNQSVGFVAY
jgi:hypothetical protein